MPLPSSVAIPELRFVAARQSPELLPEPGLTRRILVHSETMMLVEHHMEKGWAGARHSHPHEQLAYVISGHLCVGVGAEWFEARAGDSFIVKGGVEHQAFALEPSVVLDVFTPARDDYAPK